MHRANTIVDDDVARFRQSLGTAMPAEIKPVLVGCYMAQHFFFVVCDFAQGSICVFGKNIKKRLGSLEMDPAALEEWRGNILWDAMRKLFGWRRARTIHVAPQRYYMVNWKQV